MNQLVCLCRHFLADAISFIPHNQDKLIGLEKADGSQWKLLKASLRELLDESAQLAQ